MSQRQLIAIFRHEEHLIQAATAVRKRGWKIVDAFTPYAVHGLDRALGFGSSRLSWVCFFCGMFGFLGMLWFEHWTASINWAVNVGGKPWNALPSDVPVAFEAGVLLAGFGSVFALFAVSHLFPGNRRTAPLARLTDDRFMLVIDESDAAFDEAEVAALLQKYQVCEISEVPVSPEGKAS